MFLDRRRAVQFIIALVMFIGLLVAASNLPVLTHCQYYGECNSAQADAPAGTAADAFLQED